MKIALIYHEKLREYDFGSGHPFRGDRFTDFMRLFKELKLHEDPTFDIVEPKPADDRDLLLVHDSGYISLLKRMNEKGGMLTLDTPMHPGIFEAAKLLVGSSLTAADLVGKGTYVKGVAIGGGLHHAARDRGGGFCLLNDVAISVAHLLRKYSLKRVLILDTDAHAGDGTSEIFYGDPRVLFISMHQDPLTLYPGVGFVDEIGTGDGTGYNVNVPLPPMASDSSFKHVFSEIVDPLASEFKPEVVFRNGGSDPHFADGLTNLGLTMNGFRFIGSWVSGLADRLCGGKLVDCIGSGYNRKVLPYAWLALISGIANLKIEFKEPERGPKLLESSSVLAQTKETVERVRDTLQPYWSCFK